MEWYWTYNWKRILSRNWFKWDQKSNCIHKVLPQRFPSKRVILIWFEQMMQIMVISKWSWIIWKTFLWWVPKIFLSFLYRIAHKLINKALQVWSTKWKSKICLNLFLRTIIQDKKLNWINKIIVQRKTSISREWQIISKTV